jgi:hypothetical protein
MEINYRCVATLDAGRGNGICVGAVHYNHLNAPYHSYVSVLGGGAACSWLDTGMPHHIRHTNVGQLLHSMHDGVLMLGCLQKACAVRLSGMLQYSITTHPLQVDGPPLRYLGFLQHQTKAQVTATEHKAGRTQHLPQACVLLCGYLASIFIVPLANMPHPPRRNSTPPPWLQLLYLHASYSDQPRPQRHSTKARGPHRSSPLRPCPSQSSAPQNLFVPPAGPAAPRRQCHHPLPALETA